MQGLEVIMPEVASYTSDPKAHALKVPPHSIEAEQSVLGGLMIDPQAWDRIADRIQENDFYRPDHRQIFEAIRALAERHSPIDVLTVAEVLKERDVLEKIGGDIVLFELAKNTPSAANITAYADIVHERSILRQLLGVTYEIAEFTYRTEGRTSHEILDEAERKVFAISDRTSRNQNAVPIKRLLSKAVDRIDHLYHSNKTLTGLETGYYALDEVTAGLQSSDLVIIAGRPSMGKTSFAMNIAEHAAIKGDKPVLVFSLEMPGEALALRMLSSLGRIDQHTVRTGRLKDADWPRLSSAVSMLSEARLYIDDTAGLSPSEMRSRARRFTKEHGALGLIVVDYLQLMHVPGYGDNRTGEISEISRSLKLLAKELQVPLIALSQLNRSVEGRADKHPVMSDLRDSGSIEQDSDLILFIYRDEVYNENTQDKGIAEINIAKHRNGPLAKIRLTFLGQYTRFENLASEYA